MDTNTVKLKSLDESFRKEHQQLGVSQRWNINDLFKVQEDEGSIIFTPMTPNDEGTVCEIRLQKESNSSNLYTVCKQDNETILLFNLAKEIILIFTDEGNIGKASGKKLMYLFMMFEKQYS